MADLNRHQFPVVRRENKRSNVITFTAVNDSGGGRQPVGSIMYYGGRFSDPEHTDYDYKGKVAAPGEQLRLFDYRHPDGMDMFAVHPDFQGEGIGQDLANRAVEEHWRQNPGERGTMPPFSSDLTHRSRDFVEANTGEEPQHVIWENNDAALDVWAKDTVEADEKQARKMRRDAAPGTVLKNGKNYVTRMDFEPTSSLDEKARLIGAPEPAPEPEEPVRDRQMRLPGTYTRNLP